MAGGRSGSGRSVEAGPGLGVSGYGGRWAGAALSSEPDDVELLCWARSDPPKVDPGCCSPVGDLLSGVDGSNSVFGGLNGSCEDSGSIPEAPGTEKTITYLLSPIPCSPAFGVGPVPPGSYRCGRFLRCRPIA